MSASLAIDLDIGLIPALSEGWLVSPLGPTLISAARLVVLVQVAGPGVAAVEAARQEPVGVVGPFKLVFGVAACRPVSVGDLLRRAPAPTCRRPSQRPYLQTRQRSRPVLSTLETMEGRGVGKLVVFTTGNRKLVFLADSGAAVNLLLSSSARTFVPEIIDNLGAINSTPIPVVGRTELELCQKDVCFPMSFLVSATDFAVGADGIIGLEGLNQYGFVLEIQNQRLESKQLKIKAKLIQTKSAQRGYQLDGTSWDPSIRALVNGSGAGPAAPLKIYVDKISRQSSER